MRCACARSLLTCCAWLRTRSHACARWHVWRTRTCGWETFARRSSCVTSFRGAARFAVDAAHALIDDRLAQAQSCAYDALRAVQPHSEEHGVLLVLLAQIRMALRLPWLTRIETRRLAPERWEHVALRAECARPFIDRRARAERADVALTAWHHASTLEYHGAAARCAAVLTECARARSRHCGRGHLARKSDRVPIGYRRCGRRSHALSATKRCRIVRRLSLQRALRAALPDRAANASGESAATGSRLQLACGDDRCCSSPHERADRLKSVVASQRKAIRRSCIILRATASRCR